jgi:hypothetical protein
MTFVPERTGAISINKEQTMYREETALMNDLEERIAKLRGSL